MFHPINLSNEIGNDGMLIDVMSIQAGHYDHEFIIHIIVQ